MQSASHALHLQLWILFRIHADYYLVKLCLVSYYLLELNTLLLNDCGISEDVDCYRDAYCRVTAGLAVLSNSYKLDT